VDTAQLAAHIDHTLLDPTAGAEAFRSAADEAHRFGTASICVPSSRVALVSTHLSGAPLIVCATVGFPHGNASSNGKAHEAARAVVDGARELDMVIALGALLEGDYASVREDIATVVRAGSGASVKVILETGYLDEKALRAGCELAIEAGASFVKTSTGYGPRGASVEDVRAMHAICAGRVNIKASGGIRSREDALALLAAGAQRLGCSRTAAILG